MYRKIARYPRGPTPDVEYGTYKYTRKRSLPSMKASSSMVMFMQKVSPFPDPGRKITLLEVERKSLPALATVIK